MSDTQNLRFRSMKNLQNYYLIPNISETHQDNPHQFACKYLVSPITPLACDTKFYISDVAKFGDPHT